MHASFVIDASVIISWRDPREQSGYGQSILKRLSEEQAIAPIICCMEVNNVLRQFEKRGLITHDAAQETIAFISMLPINLDNAPLSFKMPHVIELASKYDLSIYDSCYLELALRLHLPLATMDNKLEKAARNAGLKLKERAITK
ncbi:MAG: type II toxin-antitoxin system VapC family toxin [Clostridiales bacterium]|jgi:predicted nucleic acid-binding protein|nr:type II toxin-antitoxin system VapC family toxin [Clostridiales bacterium]